MKIPRLEVIAGPMYSGKSTELIRRVKRATIAKQKVMVIRPLLDTQRYPDVQTHDEIQLGKQTKIIPCVFDVDNLTKLTLNECPEILFYDVIAIDEAQFFSSFIVEFVDALLDNDKVVIFAGLDMNAIKEPFGSMPILMAKANEVLKLTAICSVCQSQASKTYKKTISKKEDLNVAVGGIEDYEARCDMCHRIRE